MALPIKITIENVEALTLYLSKKPTGATLREARTVLDAKHVDARKISALKAWNLLAEEGDRMRLTSAGRTYANGTEVQKHAVLVQSISSCPPYIAIVERAAHRGDESCTSTDVAAHWHEHFRAEAGQQDSTLNLQAIAFFNIAQGAGLGTLTVGRRGSSTRIDWDKSALQGFVGRSAIERDDQLEPIDSTGVEPPSTDITDDDQVASAAQEREESTLGQAIFLGHGKNKKTLEQLKKILGGFSIPFKIAVDEPNLGRPIGQKVRDTMRECNCAILMFTADEELHDNKGKPIWRPSENVVHELGACSYLYGERVVIIKEDKVVLPTNFSDMGYISFADGELDAKAMDIVKELIGFGILKIST